MHTFTPNTVTESAKVNANFTGLADGSEVIDGAILPRHISASLGEGWLPTGDTPDTITYNGNRSYTLVFNTNDLTDTLSEGMRLRTTRTVSAPTQCADLEASSSQYFNDTSVSGMTFTDDFVCSAWVKLESYATNQAIISRFNGTSGWELRVDTSGQVSLIGYNAASGNYSLVQSYQSLPLNKWVHVAAQLDMSAFTATTTTSFVMIDGVDVPCSVSRAGTNPTALVQAGNLEVGARNGGTNPFDGKIAQVAVFNAKVTQATMRSYMSQGLAGTETSLVSAYSFSNSINDLNANANNLTAQGGALATNVDSPFGNYLGGTLEYAIITKKAFSTNTTLTVQVPEGCTIPTSGGVSAVAYSTQSVPYGFPKEKEKWRVSSQYRIDLAQASPVSGTYYDIGAKLTFPIGSWVEGYEGTAIVLNGTNSPNVTVSLSTSASALTDNRFTGKMSNGVSAANNNQLGYITRSHPVTETAATLKYLILASGTASATSIGFRGTSDNSTTIIYADLAYL